MKKMPHPKARGLTKIIVRKRFVPGQPHLARMHIGPIAILAAIGRTGVSHRKREGDGASPAGVFHLQDLYFRRDRVKRTSSFTSARPIDSGMGWCDDGSSRRYNRPVEASARESHENLWRQDEVYDVLISTSHNQRPRVLGAGSAIFMHLARRGYEATQGCVAISLADMRRLLPRLSAKARLQILP